MEQEAPKEEKRYIKNKFPDYKPNADLGALKQETMKVLIKQLLEFEEKINPDDAYCPTSENKLESHSDCYIGLGGYMYAYIKLYKFWSKNAEKVQEIQQLIPLIKDEQLFQMIDAQRYLLSAEKCLKEIQQLPDKDKNNQTNVSFYFSLCGAYTLACQLYYHMQNANQFNLYLQKVLSYKKNIITNLNSKEMAWELLYGVPGYLYCLLELQREFQYNDAIKEQYRINIESHVIEICEAILDRGKKNSQSDKVMSFSFYKREYIGAAHGYFGIIYLLERAYQLNELAFKKYKDEKFIENFLACIEMTFKNCILHQLQSGNFSTAVGEKQDKLVQFCHGAPGSILPLILTSVLFKNKEFTNVAIEAGQTIWHQGIIKKGNGLCHGITGNGYSFLQLYNHTQDLRWLYSAYRFATAVNDPRIKAKVDQYDHFDRKVIGKSDYPYSLMLGTAGDICYYIDCLMPEETQFPGYQV